MSGLEHAAPLYLSHLCSVVSFLVLKVVLTMTTLPINWLKVHISNSLMRSPSEEGGDVSFLALVQLLIRCLLLLTPSVGLSNRQSEQTLRVVPRTIKLLFPPCIS
jgi:hypothetical protein